MLHYIGWRCWCKWKHGDNTHEKRKLLCCAVLSCGGAVNATITGLVTQHALTVKSIIIIASVLTSLIPLSLQPPAYDQYNSRLVLQWLVCIIEMISFYRKKYWSENEISCRSVWWRGSDISTEPVSCVCPGGKIENQNTLNNWKKRNRFSFIYFQGNVKLREGNFIRWGRTKSRRKRRWRRRRKGSWTWKRNERKR